MTDYKKTKIRVALYIRVSTQEQAKEGYSIGEQTDRLKKYAEAHDWCVVKIYTDAGHSGANQERPALQDMICDIEAGRIDKVCVYKLDRLSRSQKDTLELIEDVMLKNSCDFESMTEKFDTATSFGRAMVGILAVFAQLEREQIKERMSMGMEARIKQGKWRGGSQTPFGYDYEAALDKLVINEYEAMIVKQVFAAFCEGKAFHIISDELVESGHTLRNGKADVRALRYMVTNKTYCGFQRHNNDWIKSLHDPIIDEDTYNKAQEIVEERQRRYEESGHRSGVKATSTVLGGMLFCKRCGGRYGKYATGSKEYGFFQNYACYSRTKKVKAMIKDPNCKNKHYRMDDLNNMIFNEIKKLKVDPEYIKLLKKEAEKTDEVQKIKSIEHQIKNIGNQLSRFMDLYGLGRYSIEELDEKTAPLTAQRTKLKKELEKLTAASKRLTEDQVMHLVESFDEVLESSDIYAKRSIVEQLIDRIEIDGEIVTIHWNFI